MSVGLHVSVDRLGTVNKPLLKALSWSVPPGAVCTLMGPSGVGKSSLLGAIAGTLSIVADGLTPLIFEGSVFLDGERLDTRPAHERGIGLVTQDPLLFPHLTVAENLAFAMNRHTSKAERAQQVKDALQAANLRAMSQADPSQLSGGERARIALMRALLAKPRALLLDEPFSKLDDSLRQHIREWFFRQVTQRGIPAILVTHDPADIADHSRVIQLNHA